MKRLLLAAMCLLTATGQAETVCKTNNANGITRCKNSSTGTEARYRVDPHGKIRDDQGNVWRQDPHGKWRNDKTGTIISKDSNGIIRDNKGNTWKRSSDGSLRGSNGTICKKDLQGTVRCKD